MQILLSPALRAGHFQRRPGGEHIMLLVREGRLTPVVVAAMDRGAVFAYAMNLDKDPKPFFGPSRPAYQDCSTTPRRASRLRLQPGS